MMSWHPDRYLAFDDHRTRPAADLLARVDFGERYVAAADQFEGRPLPPCLDNMHRVDFRDAALIFKNSVVESEDKREDYGERRYRA